MKKVERSADTKKTGRMANLELLRCIAMMMVIVLHYLGKGGLLGESAEEKLTVTQTVAWVLESFCIVAVNVYMMISGYFLSSSSFKPRRLIELWLQVWFYSVGIGLLGAVTGLLPAGEFDTHYLLTLLFPVTMEHYWFMTAYVFLYLLLPLVGLAVRKMTKKQFQVALGGLLLVFCVLKSILPIRLETDQMGYDCLWYLCVFLTAAYIRRFGIPCLKKRWQCICLYVGSCAAIFGEAMALRFIYQRTGSLGLIVNIPLEYNHIFAFLAAVGLFMTFLMTDVSGIISKVALRIAPYTLGVYLLHENMGVRYAWQDWFGADKISSVIELVISVMTAVVAVFVIGVAVDAVRAFLMRGLHDVLLKLGLYRRFVEKLKSTEE